MDKKIKPYRRLPSKPPGPKFQCCTKLYLVSSALGFDFCPPAPNAPAQRQQWNLGLQGRRQYSRGLISSSIYGLGTGMEPCTQAASYHRTREDFGLSSAQIPVLSYYLIPNSISFSITYSYYLIPITCVFSGKRCSGRLQEKKRLSFFPYVFERMDWADPLWLQKHR